MNQACLKIFAGVLLSLPLFLHAATDPLSTPAYIGQKASSALMLDVVETAGRLIAVGAHGVVVYSDNGGKDWSQADVPVSVTLTAVCFPNPRMGWAVGHDGVILHTQDGGLHWTKQFDGNQANDQVLSLAGRHLKEAREAEARDESSHAALVEAAGRAVEDAKADAKYGPSRPLLDVWFRNEFEGFAVGSFGQIFRTSDGGKAWRLWSDRLQNPDSLHYNAITATPSGALLIAGEGGKVYRSTDAGSTWSTLDTGYGGQLYGVMGLRSEKDREILVAFGFGGHAFRSMDGGSTWQSVAVPTKKPLVAGVGVPGRQVCLMAQDGLIFCSGDEATNFLHTAGTAGMPVAAFVLTRNAVFVQAGVNGMRTVLPNNSKAEK